ncbi:hypothetical protein [Pseudomonas sp. GL-RE-20]|uniref:hypothetical protein n=1 Tax=Pseudomonas sp. GL-RE-20 TaxID=2832372 RepID=UPI001CC1A27F|nr:hypothetical protein [Pseudomonas sp. GL-RE-20]
MIYHYNTRDVVIVHINPLVRPGVPITAAEILNRINEISFNSSLVREMRTIAFVTDLIQQGKVDRDEMKEMLIHSIRSDEAMRALSVPANTSRAGTSLRTARQRTTRGRGVAHGELPEYW